MRAAAGILELEVMPRLSVPAWDCPATGAMIQDGESVWLVDLRRIEGRGLGLALAGLSLLGQCRTVGEWLMWEGS